MNVNQPHSLNITVSSGARSTLKAAIPHVSGLNDRNKAVPTVLPKAFVIAQIGLPCSSRALCTPMTTAQAIQKEPVTIMRTTPALNAELLGA